MRRRGFRQSDGGDLAIFALSALLPGDKSLPGLGGASLIADMQIFFGTCLFLVGVVMLAYVPGKLLLLLLKRTLTPLADVTLACVVGLVVSGLAYWLITVAHQARFYLVWPLTAAAVFVWLHCSKRKSLLHHSESRPPTEKARSSRATDPDSP